MDLRYIALLLVGLILEILFLSKELKFKQNDTKTNINILFEDSTTYQIKKDGIKQILLAKKIEDKNKQKIFIDPIVVIYDTYPKTIIAKKAILFKKDTKLKMIQNVNLYYKDFSFFTQFLLYDLPTSCIIDTSRFKALATNLEAKGNHLFFDTKKNIIKAKDVNFKYFLKE